MVEQAGVAHWSSRVDALQSLLELLTTECRGERGQLVLESRPVSKRLEAVIAERARDAHFKVVAAALKLLGGLVAAHPDLMAGQAFALLPLVRTSMSSLFSPSPVGFSRFLHLFVLLFLLDGGSTAANIYSTVV